MHWKFGSKHENGADVRMPGFRILLSELNGGEEARCFSRKHTA
jgi:hypothetical protein